MAIEPDPPPDYAGRIVTITLVLVVLALLTIGVMVFDATLAGEMTR